MNWIKENLQKNKFIFIVKVLAAIVFIIMIFLFFRFESTMSFMGIDPKKMTDEQWATIKNVGYAFGMLLLIIQISISNLRANALEKTAKATLASNVEQRYHNAIEHLTNENTVIRIGAIYNLYHISQTTNTYDTTIFDMFCEYLKDQSQDLPIKIKGKVEKQIIIDKLFKAKKNEIVLKNPKNINLTGVDLTGVDLTGVGLTGVDLTGAKLDSCVFDEADLSKATLPANLTTIKSMNKAIIDGVNFCTGSDLQGLKLKQASWKNAQVRYTNLSNADLSNAKLDNTDFTGSDLTGVTGLTLEQLSKVKYLCGVKGLNKKLEKKLRIEKPELFKPLMQEKTQ